MRVRWTETAFSELREIRDYIARDNPTAAKSCHRSNRASNSSSGDDSPHMGSTTDSPGIRVLLALPFRTSFFTWSKAGRLSFATSAMEVGGGHDSENANG